MDVPRLASSFHSVGTSHCSDVPVPGAAQEVLQDSLRGLGRSGHSAELQVDGCGFGPGIKANHS